jgi:flagellar FliJ protein
VRPFRFRAARVLELRQQREDDARVTLVKAQHAASSAEGRVRAAEEEADGAVRALDATQRRGAPAWLIGWHRSWIARTTEEADLSRREAAVAAARVAQAEAALREAHKERRVLERLRDRLAARHARELARFEMNQMNELAGRRYQAAATDRKEQG